MMLKIENINECLCIAESLCRNLNSLKLSSENTFS